MSAWRPAEADDYEPDECHIVTTVDGTTAIVDMHMFLETHAALASKHRAAGLEGSDLDAAIAREMPTALGAKLGMVKH